MPEVAESIADANRSCDSAYGLAQNDSIVGGFEISNGNERRIQSCTSGENLLTLIYLYLRLTKIGRMVDFLSYPIK